MARPRSTEEMVDEFLPRLHGGDCPKCGGAGPTDLHAAFRCRSAIVTTEWGPLPLVSCRRCGMAHQGRILLETALSGWWSRRGLFLTPVQLSRTLFALLLPPSPRAPSPALREHVHGLMAAERREKYLPRCPACSEPYDPEDYREDAEEIFCARCKGVLPREAQVSRS